MALDRIWQLRIDGFISALEPVWLGLESQSHLAGVGESDTTGLRPLETVTVRMRWRPDLSLATVFHDPDLRPWYVNEVLEVGRRHWLDVSLSRYSFRPVFQTNIPEERTVPDSTPPDGWTLVDGQGDPVRVVRVEDAIFAQRQGGGGDFAFAVFRFVRETGDTWGATGAYPPGRGRTWDASLRVTGRVQPEPRTIVRNSGRVQTVGTLVWTGVRVGFGADHPWAFAITNAPPGTTASGAGYTPFQVGGVPGWRDLQFTPDINAGDFIVLPRASFVDNGQ